MSRGGRVFLFALYGLLIAMPVGRVLLRYFEGDSSRDLARILGQMDLPALLANSLFLALFATVLAVLLGVPAGLLFGLKQFPLKGLLQVLALLPLLIPPHIHTIAWARVLGDMGWLSGWLRETLGWAPDIRAPLGDPSEDAFFGHLYPGPAWILACATFPLVAFSVRAGVLSLDRDSMLAARIAGTGGIVRRIVLPQILPRILAGAAFVFILALTSYPVVSLLDTPTLIQKVFFALNLTLGDQLSATILGLPLVLAALLVVLGLGAVMRGHPPAADASSRFQPEQAGLSASVAAAAILGAALVVPLVSLLAEAGPVRFGGEPDNYQSVFARVQTAFAHSILFSACGVAILTGLGAVMGRVLLGMRGIAGETAGIALLAFPPEIVALSLLVLASEASAGLVPLSFVAAAGAVIALPLVLPGPSPRRWKAAVLVFGIFTLALAGLQEAGVLAFIQQRGFVLVLLALAARFLPFTARIFLNGYEAAGRDAGRAAALAGRSALSRLLRIELPMMRPTVVLAALFAWVLCFTELPATLIALRPGWQTVQMRIFNMVHYQSIGEVSALCVLAIAMALLPLLVAKLWPGPRRRTP